MGVEKPLQEASNIESTNSLKRIRVLLNHEIWKATAAKAAA
jgi:hypothetical protein